MRSTTGQRLASALERRAALIAQSDTNAYRLINRAGDGFPDLSVDRFADVLVANLYSAGQLVKPPMQLLRDLAERVEARSVYVKYRPVQANMLDEEARRALAPARPVIGEPAPVVIASENGLRFLIRPGEGLNPGLFLDMREMRSFVRGEAAGKTVLNCFAYTCGFGTAALSGGAARAVNLDVSRNALEWGKRSAELNGHAINPRDFIFGDVFDWLKRFGRRSEKFDLVILDPPSYSSTRQTRFTVERDYAALVALAAPVVAPGGWLIACANTHTVPTRAFLAQVRQGLSDFRARVVRTEHEPKIDFPAAPGEQPYLKIALVRFDES